jgi:hypothetical protein
MTQYPYDDPKIYVMICSRCHHINEVTEVVCTRCSHDAGTPAFRVNAENLRRVQMRLNNGLGPDPEAIERLDAFFSKAPLTGKAQSHE